MFLNSGDYSIFRQKMSSVKEKENSPLSPLDPNIIENLMKYCELEWAAHLHTERLAHAVFVALTTLITGIWTISFTYLDMRQRIVVLFLSSFIPLAGLYLIYKFQRSNDVAHVIINRIRRKLCLEDLKVEINNDESPIFPEWYRKYKLKEIKDVGIIPRKGIKAGGKLSWWAMYKWMFLAMFFGGMIMSLYLYLTPVIKKDFYLSFIQFYSYI